MTEEWISLGQLGKPFGLKGFLRLNVRETVLSEIALPIDLRLKKPDPQFPEKKIQLLEIQKHSGKFIVRLDGITTPEEAERLVGATLFLPKRMLPNISVPDEFYVSDLIGLRARNESGQPLDWILKDVQENPAHEILVFSRPNQEDVLVPFVGAFVGTIDLKQKTILLIQPEVWDEI
ncbi:16S rRNA processing protein RimM [Leptospira gomenensis]|uniref:Ribosome maturation factor RimM n=1 Tax=Leptospira gomenensis TaxID=2484974 RepID=A0A5F1YC98_9LEPT|nr:ribosome maturation factor RimM [Leptospira gomenensis]TGK35035.1 16S rRNA processing protein RimM [Leptospira gomenensis]TGK35287.1 16S rRNA processing protein RimM [Leptospira gomenensis]TGK51772.1 16S rRNA processing protein RimM [Leptospira gomenensis]TGK58367.1 16S rRNA processing protein RimM [Leptospira gomenensis]